MFRLSAFRYAWKGVIYFITNERHAPIHLFCALLVIILGLILNLQNWEWIALLICISAVITAEMFNSALEKLTDLVSPDWNELAGKVKDMAAGAVLVSSILAAVIGLIILAPKLYKLLNF